MVKTDYIDPFSGQNLGALDNVNNPYLAGNPNFEWNFELETYEPSKTPTNEVFPPNPSARDVLPLNFFDDYTPSLDTPTEKPFTELPGFHYIIAADIRRGDLFLGIEAGFK